MPFLKLSVTGFNGAPLGSALSANFDETGGEIGRADTNTLVLPDPERTISRVHARVVFRNGAFALIDEGSNAVHHNGMAIGKGREAPLRPGDRVQIGGYVIEVAAGTAGGAPAQAADPFADFFGMAPTAPSPAAASSDPLGLGLGAPTPLPGPRPPSPPPLFGPVPPMPAPAPSAGPMMGIPDDWDAFAAPAPVANRPAPSPAAQALGLDFGAGAPAALIPDLPRASGGGDSLDQLFGLGAPGPKSGSPLANSLLDAPVAQPNMAAHADPLRSLGSLGPSTTETRRDDYSDLSRPFIPPPTLAPGVPVAAPVAPVPPPAAPVLSWDNGATEGRTVIRPGGGKAAGAPATLAPGVAAAPTPVPVAAAPAGSTQELLDAFRQGLGQPGLNLPALDPALMRLVGELLKEATQGTVDLLVARAALKREVRAQATMIVAKENNPLKFSPSAEAAMAHLLGPQVRGFMPAGQAMRDAFDDLRAHQIAFLAGMRAALEGLLARFDPSSLESHLSQKSVLGSLLPNARKAQLWGVFQQEYAQIAKEASDDFQQLFGREFLRAYEDQIDQLKQK